MTTDQENLNAEDQLDETEADVIDEPLEDEADATAADETDDAGAEGEENKDEVDPKDQEIAELRKQVDVANGRVGSERGNRLVLNKVLKFVEDNPEQAANRDAIAEAVGLDRRRLDGILDAPNSDDSDEYLRRARVADKQLDAVAKVLKANGKDRAEIGIAYVTLLNSDPEERQRFMDTPEDEVGNYVINRVSEVEAKVRPLVIAKGNALEAVSSLQTRIAELEAENADLKAGRGQSKQQRVPLTGGAATPPAKPSGPGGAYGGF
jgi:hypothetical protein